jgi:hypothetical protein
MSFLNKVYAAIGDWKKAGYELVFITGRSKVFAYGYSLGVNNLRSSYGVFALDSKGKLAGWLLVMKDGAGVIAPLDVKIRPPHKRKGLATAMYQLAEEKTGRKFRRGVQSPDAQKLWDQKDRPFGKDD